MKSTPALALFQHAIELLQSATHRGGQHVNFKSTTEKVQRALAAAKKDNDFIYHDIVPEIANLKSIGSAPIAKPLEIPSPLYLKFSGVCNFQGPRRMLFLMDIHIYVSLNGF